MLTKVLLLALLAGLTTAAPLETRRPLTEIGNTNNVFEREAQDNDHQPWGNGKREAQGGNDDQGPWGYGDNGKRQSDGGDQQPWEYGGGGKA